MHIRTFLSAITMLVLVAATSIDLRAQEAGSLGVTFGVGWGGSLGVIYHPSAHIAIHPDVSFRRNTGESEYVGEGPQWKNSSESWSISGGLTVQYRLGTIDNLSSYVGLGGGYGVGKSSGTSSSSGSWSGTDTTMTQTSTSKSYGARALFGLQYAFNKRFNVYGELGAWYGGQVSRSDSSPDTRTSGTNLSLSSSQIGVIFYLN
jgi:opacity protein-like surface antigen